jgi:hypothetical protein
MRLVFWCAGLEVKGDGEFIRMPALKFGKLPKFFTRNHEHLAG